MRIFCWETGESFDWEGNFNLRGTPAEMRRLLAAIEAEIDVAERFEPREGKSLSVSIVNPYKAPVLNLPKKDS